jgi:MFS transporter, DHA2 family, multidrug resistance protein
VFRRLFEDQPDDDGKPGAQRRIVYTALLLAGFVTVLDSTIVVVALPTLAREFGISAAASVWAVNGFLIATAASLLAFSGLGGKFGLRPTFLFGIAAFTVASLICGTAQSFEMLVTGRVLQGIGAAAVMSVGPAILRSVFPIRLMGTVVGMTAMVIATGTAIGPALGGMILSIADWHWIFLLNLPLGVFAWWRASRGLPREPGHGGDFDFIGAALSGVALGAMVIAVDGLAHQQAITIVGVLSAVTVASGMGFVARQRRAANPIMPLDIFRIRRFRVAAMTSVSAFTTQGIAFTALPFALQETQQQGLLASGLLFAIWPLTIIIAAPIAGRLSDHYHAPTLCTCGLAVMVCGLALLALAGTTDVWDMAWRTVLCGLGFGFFQAPNNLELNTSVPRERVTVASGIIATARTVGQALGAALAALALGTADATSSVTAAPITALWIAAGIASIAMLISGSRLRIRAT